MNAIHSVPRFLQKYMVFSIPVALLLGFLFGLNFDAKPLKVWVMPLTFLMIYPSMVGLNFKQVFSHGDSQLQLVTMGMNFLVLPSIAYGLGWFFFADNPMLHLGLFLTGLLPTSGMTLAWTQMASGNLPSAVKMTVIGLVVGSLLTPFYMKGAFGTTVDMPLAQTLVQIALIVFLPLVLAFLTQRIALARFGKEKFVNHIKPKFGPWGTMGVLGVQFVAMALKAPDLAANPKLLLWLGIPMLVFYLLNFVVSTLLAKLFVQRADGVAFIYGTVLRNLSIALAISMTVLGSKGSEVALLISIGFVFQAQLAAWHVKMLPYFIKK